MAKKVNNITEQSVSLKGNPVVSPLVVKDPNLKEVRSAIREAQLEAPNTVANQKNNSTTNTPTQPNIVPVPTFGIKSRDITTYPNDVVRLDLYNAIDVYLGTNYRVDDFKLQQPPTSLAPQSSIGDTPSPTISAVLRVDDNVRQLGYNSGKYKTTYKFHRNILGSGDGHKLAVQEISADRLELRIVPILSDTLDNENFISQFQEGLFKTPKSEILSNLFLFKEANNFFQVFDYVQDRFTISSSPYSIILKLTAPIPANILVGDELWLAQQVSSDYDSEAVLTALDDESNRVSIAGANFEVLAKQRTNISTNYKDKEDLVSTNNTTSHLKSLVVLSWLLVQREKPLQPTMRLWNIWEPKGLPQRWKRFSR